MLEVEMVRLFVWQISPPQIRALRDLLMKEQEAVSKPASSGRVELQGDFHLLIAKLLGNTVLQQMLRLLISRCALITHMYQSARDEPTSNREHIHIVAAMVAKDEEQSVQLMEEHLLGEVSKLSLAPSSEQHEETQVFESSYMATMEAPLADIR
jgi:DNA-binding GntR family transcriptional regulator